MKTNEQETLVLKKIILHGSQFGKHTGYHQWPGFVTAHYTNGKQSYLGDISYNQAVLVLKARGVDCSEFERLQAEYLAKLSYPPKPEQATEYQTGDSYEKPVALGEWDWSTTFGRWGRTVTFANGWTGFTWPKTW